MKQNNHKFRWIFCSSFFHFQNKKWFVLGYLLILYPNYQKLIATKYTELTASAMALHFPVIMSLSKIEASLTFFCVLSI